MIRNVANVARVARTGSYSKSDLNRTLDLPMGEISYFSTTGTAVVISAQSNGATNMVKVAPVTALTAESMMFDNGGADNGALRYIGEMPGVFHTAVTFSLNPASANDAIVLGIAVNGTPNVFDKVTQFLTATADVQATSIHAMLNLVQNDVITLYVGNMTAAANVTVKSLNIFSMGSLT